MSQITAMQQQIEKDSKVRFIRSRYPDAHVHHYAKLAICIWCPLLNRALSMYFHTEDEAINDAVARIIRNEKKYNQ